MILAQHAPYDFDTILERHGSSSAKWHEVVEQMGEDGKDVVPLSWQTWNSNRLLK